MSQPHLAQPPAGQAPYGQPPYGQPPTGQPPYGQPAPPYGQPQQFGGPAPQFAPQTPYGGRPGAPVPPGITVDSSYTPMAFLLGLLTKPKIKINGQQVPATRWGPTHIPVGPGTYQVWVATPWLFDMGSNQMPVQVNDGPGTKVYYRTPAVFFLNGAIGMVPQKTPGIAFIYVSWAFVALIVLLSFVSIIAASSV
ncbi:hypothetical protein [Nocardia australiensis]|uniref:hypothetical protein n=1 Tax=Nocardia australiensis TaxID=2887191 RepID=UPI001D146EEE|nr:hypothetical protein [Nocardia australiensis]